MKKAIIILTVALIFFGNRSEAGIYARYDWWNYRIKEIEKLKSEIAKDSGIDRAVIAVFDREIESGRKFLNLIEENITKDKKSNAVKKFTIQEINEEIKRAFNPLFCLYYLNSLGNYSKSFGDHKYLKERTALILSRLRKDAKLRGSSRNDNKLIAERDRSALYLEVLLGNMIINKPKLPEYIKNEVSKDIILKLAEKNYTVDPFGMARIVRNGIVKYLDRFDFINSMDFSEKAVSESFSRKRYNLYNKKSHSKDDLLNEYAYRMKRIKQYVIFLEDLIGESSKSYVTGDSRIREMFSGTYPAVKRIIKFMKYSLGIDKGSSIYSGSLIKVIDKKRKAFAHDLAKIQRKIDIVYKRSYNSFLKTEENRRRRLEKFKENIAQHDVDCLYKNIIGYVNAFRKYGYARYIFSRYSEEFDRLKNDARAGKFSAGLKKALKRDSIFPLIKKFNGARIKREYGAGKLLKREGALAIARLKTLLKYYRHMKIEIADTPDLKKLNEFKNVLNRRSGMKISSWVINSANFALVDKKAVKLLRDIAEKKMWLGKISGKSEKVNINGRLTPNSSGMELYISIPEGWNEKTVKEEPGSGKILKYYTGPDNKTSISIAAIKTGRGLKETSENWAKRISANLIEKRWGKKDDYNYFWILSKDNKNNVMQIYTFSKNGTVYIICGRSEGGKYIFFRRIFDRVFNSLRFEL